MKRSKTQNILFVLLFALLFGISGYFRDLIFRYTNAQINLEEYGGESFPFYPGRSFLGVLTLKQLYVFKWCATLFFYLLVWSFTLLAVRVWFHVKLFYRLVHGSFLLALVLSGIGFMIGKWAHSDQGYYFARWLMGATQSPVLTMILMMVFLGMKKNTTGE